MTSVIDRQIESLELSTAEIATSPPAHEAVAARRDFEDLLAMAVALYGRIKSGVERWQASVADWSSSAWVAQARKFEASYRKLHDTFERVSALLVAWESSGYPADGADRFRATKIELDLLYQLSIDRMLKADESLRQGKGRPMAEVRDELRRRLGA